MKKEERRSIYIETIHNDSIVIWETFSRFEEEFAPISSEFLNQDTLNGKKENLFIQRAPTIDNYPATGIILTFECDSEDFNKAETIMMNYFKCFHPKIQFKEKPPKLDVIFPNYESLVSYLTPLYNIMSKKNPKLREELI
jgi:hypothetical protein